MHSMNIEDIIKQSEGKTLEFKENINSKDKILSTIIAFSNTSGGTILIGITDKTRHIVGVPSPHQVADAIANIVYDSVEPRILPNIEVIPYRNTHLVKIEVYPSSLRPHFKRGKSKQDSTYIRIGSTTRLADQDLLKTVERSVVTKSFDEDPCYAESYANLDVLFIAQLLKAQEPLQSQHLLTLGLAIKDNDELIATNGGVLLFSPKRLQYFSDAWIQLGVFEGLDKTTILNTQKITSYLTEAPEEVLNFIKQNLQIKLKIKDIRHEEIWEIPKVALREAVINAIVHTDYSLRGAPIRVSIFKDRIEIENTALLLWGLTFEDLRSGVSKLRNPVIARIFSELKLIEQWGSGIKRMIQACEDAGLPPPLFEEIGPRIRVTFYKEKIKQPNIDGVDKEILEFLKISDLTTQEINSLMNLSRRTIIYRLAKLVDRGLIISISQSPTDPYKKYKLRT